MRKDFISGFSCFAQYETNFFSYLNLTQNKFGTFVFAKILQNKCGSKCETWIHKNDFKNTRSKEPLYKNTLSMEPLYKNNQIFWIFPIMTKIGFLAQKH